jgi:hypothetical protein
VVERAGVHEYEDLAGPGLGRRHLLVDEPVETAVPVEPHCPHGEAHLLIVFAT